MQTFKERLFSRILRQTKSDEVFLFLNKKVLFIRFLQNHFTPIKVSSKLLSFCWIACPLLPPLAREPSEAVLSMRMVPPSLSWMQ